MRQTKRKIVALSTAFVMAFALVAAMVPTVSEAATPITSVSFTIDKPVAGVTVAEEGFFQTNRPVITTTTRGINTQPDCLAGNWCESTDNYDPANPPSNWYGKFEDGKDYYVAFWSLPEDGYTFADNCQVTVNGEALSASNFTTSGGGELYAYCKVTCGNTTPASVPVKEGDNQTVAPGSPVVISFDKDFSKFENGGAVFLDESTEPLSTDCYTATSGSTVITLLDSFTKTLPGGTHTLKVKFNDDSVGTASFIVSASANSDGSASGTSGTATSGTSSSAATTTKVAAPKTADVLPFAAIAVVFVGATAIGVIAFRRKNS